LHIKLIAQPYESVFGKDTTQWNIVYHIPDYFPTLIFKAYGDTLINEEKYVPVYMGDYGYPLELYGYLKEDTIAGRLWCRYINGNEELLMDLSLAKNDSFYFGRNESIPYVVDSVYYDSGKKVVSFAPIFSNPVRFTEGLGAFNMFYNVDVDFPEYAQVRCKHKDNILVFINSNNGTCVDTFTSANNYTEESIGIYPNPACGYLKISNNSTEVGTLELINSLGYHVLSLNIVGNEQIDISNFPNGVYLVKFQLQNKHFITKIMKK